MSFDLTTFNVKRFDKILAKGLSSGLGNRASKVCIEAAICQTLGLPHGDDPGCVAESVRSFKIALNDSLWSSPQERAKGLRDLGIAQLGSKGVVDNQAFTSRLQELTIRILLPDLFRLFDDKGMRQAADTCEQAGTKVAAAEAAEAARWAAEAAEAAWAAKAARWAAEAAEAAGAAEAARWAAGAAGGTARWAANNRSANYYLNLSATLALQVLRELNSPGVSLLDQK